MKDVLQKYKSQNPAAPNNLYHISENELIKLGFKRRVFKGELKYKQGPYSEVGDLLCAANKEKSAWIKLDERSAKSIDPEKFLVYHL